MRSASAITGPIAILLAGAYFGSVGSAQGMKESMKSMGGMARTEGMMSPSDAPTVPPVTGYSEGRQILFLHTEASDPKIAKILTDMMGSPVFLVPSLAKAPRALLARVYVFTNGLKGDGPLGPLGYQPDVFEAPPGQPDYSPLRTIALVTWKEGISPRLLKSEGEVRQALAAGEVTLEEPGVVVNMPFLTWPGGRR